MIQGAGRAGGGLLLLSAAYAWLLGNAAYVYLVAGGRRAYRVETAAFIFIAIAAVQAGRALRVRLPDPGGRRAAGVLLGATAIAVLTIYATALTFPFLSDDYVFLSRAAAGTDERWEFFRPVFSVVFAALAAAGGRASWPFHVVALALHLASTAFAFVLANRLFRSPTAAAVTAMLFALNPVQAEAVLWVSGLQELLWTAFGLAALVVYVRCDRPGLLDLALSLALFALALGSKETAICLLLLFPAADLFLVEQPRWRRQLWAYAGLATVAIAYIAIRATAVDSPDGYLTAPSRYFLKQFVAVPYAVFAQPWSDAVLAAPGWLRFFTVILLPAVILIGAWRGALTAGALAGPAVMLIAAVPVYTYFFVSPSLQGSRYLYFPAIGWGLLVSYFVATLCTSRRAMVFTSACLFAWSTAWLTLNLRPWREAAGIVLEFAAQGTSGTWQERYGDDLVVQNGVPIEYRGVVLFRNGYPEFVAMRESGILPR